MSTDSPSARSSTSRWIWVLAGAGLLVFVWWLLRDSPSKHPVKRSSHLDETTDSSASPNSSWVATPRHSPRNSRLAPAIDPKVLARRDNMKAKRLAMIEDAIDNMRFPPDSRPFTMDMEDIVHPYHRSEYPRPLIRPKQGDSFDPKTSLYFLFTGPTYAVGPDEPLIATLEVYKGRPEQGAPPQRLEIAEIRARLLRFGQPAYEPVAEMQMNDGGHDGDQIPGDRIYTLAVMPSSIAGLDGYNGIVRVEVAFLVPEVGKPMRAALQYTVTTAMPAQFTEVRREKLTDEGLQINMGLQVNRPGYYFVQGLLFDADGKPIGFAVHRETYQKGLQEVPLTFFGLLFHQTNAKSPYVFKTVTGSKLPSDDEPSKIEIPPWKGEYRTRSYSLDDFSDSEWQSDQKNKRLEALRELADQNPDKKQVVEAPENPHPASSAKPPPAPAPAVSQ